jgi:hypothetical protein
MFKHDDGSEIKPLSIKEYYDKGMGTKGYFEQYYMNKTPESRQESDFQDNYRASKLAAIEQNMAELKRFNDSYPRTKSTLSEYANSDNMVI